MQFTHLHFCRSNLTRTLSAFIAKRAESPFYLRPMASEASPWAMNWYLQFALKGQFKEGFDLVDIQYSPIK